MDNVVLNDAPASPRPRLSATALLAIAILAVFTVLITWRAYVLETTLQREDEQPDLVYKMAPDFSALALDGRTFTLAAASDFELLAVSIDEDTKEAATFATAMRLNFPVLLDPRQRMAEAYDVHGIPTMFVIDKNGKVVFGHEGFDATMEFQLAAVLGINPNLGTNANKRGAADGDAGH
jgi:hypothetical protein